MLDTPWPANITPHERMPCMAESSRHPFGRWLESAAGQDWLQTETRLLAVLAAGLVGGHAVQVGATEATVIDEFPAVSKAVFQVEQGRRLCGSCVADGAEWPILSASVKLVVSHHAHDLVQAPDRLVGELSRVLVGGGLAIFFGLSRGPRAADARWLDSMDRQPLGRLNQQVLAAGLRPVSCRLIRSDQSRQSRVLGWLESRIPSPRWLVPLAEGYAFAARKPDDPGRILNRSALKTRTLDGAVGGSPAGTA